MALALRKECETTRVDESLSFKGPRWLSTSAIRSSTLSRKAARARSFSSRSPYFVAVGFLTLCCWEEDMEKAYDRQGFQKN